MLVGNDLVQALNKMCLNVRERLWIAVPFIGSWNAVERIIGTKWITNTGIGVRLLTDIRNESFIKQETYDKFRFRCKIRTLPGLHAKLYVVDDKALLTSANLTETAFSRRYEIGIICDTDKKLVSVFEDWWSPQACSFGASERLQEVRQARDETEDAGSKWYCQAKETKCGKRGY